MQEGTSDLFRRFAFHSLGMFKRQCWLEAVGLISRWNLKLMTNMMEEKQGQRPSIRKEGEDRKCPPAERESHYCPVSQKSHRKPCLAERAPRGQTVSFRHVWQVGNRFFWTDMTRLIIACVDLWWQNMLFSISRYAGMNHRKARVCLRWWQTLAPAATQIAKLLVALRRRVWDTQI